MKQGLGQYGATADQYLRGQRQLSEAGMDQTSNILSGYGLAQANALFGAGEAAKGREHELDMANLGYDFQRGMYDTQREDVVEDRDLAAQLAKKKMFWDTFGNIVGGVLGAGR